MIKFQWILEGNSERIAKKDLKKQKNEENWRERERERVSERKNIKNWKIYIIIRKR